MTAVHQFHPVLAPADAMSNHVFALRKRIRGWGYDSYAYAVEAKAGVADVRSYRRLFRDVKPDDMLVIHFSMGHEVIDQLVKIQARRVLVYHNITPPEFFSGINPHAAAHARLGLRQLARIAPAFELGIGVSEFNRRTLAEAGYEETTRVPILIERLGLGGAVHFAGSVDGASLLAYYRAAKCFVSLSEHEGFGVPLLEAMRFRLPVVAYDAAAIGETVGSAGVLLHERDLAEAAEAAAIVSEAGDVRERLVEAGERRVKDFDPDKVAERTRQVLGL